MESHVKIFKAFCDENRLQIITILQEGEQCACKLQEALAISQSTLSHHMKLLVDSGLVVARKSGKWTYYKLCREGAEMAKGLLTNYLTVSDQSETTCEAIGGSCL